ncbi:MAG TPA: hypothetical protein VMZ30_15640 [Pyrinomonadaceae bacterium]|nr:hypothetical protein [Pyrinomonadaceae bacterium]
MNQTNHFFDLGYGWLCKHCSAADTEANHQPPATHNSFLRAAQPEKKEAKQSGLALASWTDASRNALACPRCGIEERISTQA